MVVRSWKIRNQVHVSGMQLLLLVIFLKVDLVKFCILKN